MNEKAIGGSDVCHTCAAHVLVITEDLEPRIRALEAALRDTLSGNFPTPTRIDEIRALVPTVSETSAQRDSDGK